MKNLRTSVLCVCMTLVSLNLMAQDPNVPLNEPDYNKPRLFSSLPELIKVNTDELGSLFTKGVGNPTSLRLGDGASLQFDGQVISSGSKFENTLQSMVIRSSNFQGASFTISRIVNADGSQTFRGRIISFTHGDLLELENREGAYFLVKRNFYDLVNE